MNSGNVHWAVTLNRRNRSVFFALFFLALIPHLIAIQTSPLAWALLSLHLLIYPQLAYLWASRSPNSLSAELRNLQLDGFLFGIWMAAWGFPLWITFCMALSVAQNVVMFEGVKPLWKAIATTIAGIATGILSFGLELHLDTNFWTTMALMLGFSGYVLACANYAFNRGISLRDNRQQLSSQLVQISALRAQMEELARRDPLTGTYNRRYLDDVLSQTLRQAHTSRQPLSLLMIDIDHFKQVNDIHGHSAGDQVICRLADLLQQRFADHHGVVCRYGGEEFLVMLPGTTMTRAAMLADQIRSEFAATRIVLENEQISTTLSAGVAGYPEHDLRPHQLLDLADQALYAAKLAGRNRTVSSTDLPVGKPVTLP